MLITNLIRFSRCKMISIEDRSDFQILCSESLS
jgi:hypothetical protein